jgi:hypothetical protein
MNFVENILLPKMLTKYLIDKNVKNKKGIPPNPKSNKPKNVKKMMMLIENKVRSIF